MGLLGSLWLQHPTPSWVGSSPPHPVPTSPCLPPSCLLALGPGTNSVPPQCEQWGIIGMLYGMFATRLAGSEHMLLAIWAVDQALRPRNVRMPLTMEIKIFYLLVWTKWNNRYTFLLKILDLLYQRILLAQDNIGELRGILELVTRTLFGRNHRTALETWSSVLLPSCSLSLWFVSHCPLLLQ